MLGMNKQTYATLNIVMIVLIILSGPRGVFMKENGYNWMSASGMYVFAGFFTVHGWPCPGWLTWVIWGVIFRCEWYMSGHDLMTEVHPKMAWMFSTFRMRAPIHPRGKMDLPGGPVIYACPLTFIWGVVSLYGFRLINFPSCVSKILFFMGGKVFLIHLFDKLPISNSAIAKWTRRNEVPEIPWIRFKSLILTTVQLGACGFLLDIFRERVFTSVFQLIIKIRELMK
jgi:hypothetical protein